MKKTQKKSWVWSSLYIWYKIMLIYINFKLNFLTRQHSFILKCWRIRMLSSRRFTRRFRIQTFQAVRVGVESVIQTLPLGSSLYVRYNRPKYKFHNRRKTLTEKFWAAFISICWNCQFLTLREVVFQRTEVDEFCVIWAVRFPSSWPYMKYQKRKRNRWPFCDTNVWEARNETMVGPTVGVNTRYFAGGTKTSKVTWS
jgi:hypothetical protein